MKRSDLNKWQQKRLYITFFSYVTVFVVMLVCFVASSYRERSVARVGWEVYMSDPPEQAEMVRGLSKDATVVKTGTYIENLREINIRNSYFRVEMLAWFSWTGDEELSMADSIRVYKGLINNKRLVRDYRENGVNYQLVYLDVSISDDFETKRFPLESYQLWIYLESLHPVQEVILVADREHSGINRNLTIGGFDFLQNQIGEVTYIYDSTHGDPRLQGCQITSEVVTMMEINRSDFGLYFKCFISLVGALAWALIALFICTYHHVDPLSLLPSALFGTVGNIMVGANLLPDALSMGLLEYVNIWGIMSILGITIVIVNINRIRSKYCDLEFATYYGRIMFATASFFVIAGQVLLPLSAYIFT